MTATKVVHENGRYTTTHHDGQTDVNVGDVTAAADHAARHGLHLERVLDQGRTVFLPATGC